MPVWQASSRGIAKYEWTSWRLTWAYHSNQSMKRTYLFGHVAPPLRVLANGGPVATAALRRAVAQTALYYKGYPSALVRDGRQPPLAKSYLCAACFSSRVGTALFMLFYRIQ